MKYLTIILICFIFACSSHQDNLNYIYIPKQDLHSELEVWMSNLKRDLNKTAGIALYCNDCYSFESLLLFNKDKTKVITTLNVQNPYRNGTSDDVIGVVGRKVYGKWYFFMGANMVVIHATYKHDKYEPLSFLELSYIAREEFLRPFYKIVDGKVVPNHEAVDKAVKLPVHVYGHNNETEENTKHYIDNYIYKDKYVPQEEYDRIKTKIENSVRPPSPPAVELSFWDKLRGKKPPIFERKEWKDYIANRSNKQRHQ